MEIEIAKQFHEQYKLLQDTFTPRDIKTRSEIMHKIRLIAERQDRLENDKDNPNSNIKQKMRNMKK